MLFRRKIPKSCAYCARGTKIGEGQILCTKKGIVAETGKCCRFSYDPCKRIPVKAKALDFSRYDQDDFSL